MKIAVAGGTGTVGRHVVLALERKGHEAIVLTRSKGVDLLAGAGLDGVLRGCRAVVDVTSVDSLSGRRSLQFFSTVTANLLAAERAADVPHHVLLSIVGAAANPSGHYAGKAAQEQMVMASGRGWSILRATQFHEFAAQIVARAKLLGMVLVPKMRTQPIAASEVGDALAELALNDARGVAPDLGGPREERLADMVRQYMMAKGLTGRVVELTVPGLLGNAMANGSLLPGTNATLGAMTFHEWLG